MPLNKETKPPVTILNKKYNLKLYGIKYFYLTLPIFKQIYLNCKWDTNGYYYSGVELTWE